MEIRRFFLKAKEKGVTAEKIYDDQWREMFVKHTDE